MAKSDKNSGSETPNTPESASGAATAGAGGQSSPPAQGKKPRFTIKPTPKSGPVQKFAGVSVDDQGVGTCDIPATAWHCACNGYEVLDALNDNKPYTGAPPAKQPVNGTPANG